MRRCRRSDDAVTHCRIEKFFDARNVEVARRGAKTVPRQPQINITWFDLTDLSQPASGPIGLDSSDDEGFSLNRFRLLMLNRFQIAVAQFRQGQLSLGAINLALLVFEACKLASCNRGVGCFQAALDLLALNADSAIINAIG